jgi:ATP phosphoribosyltransferase regulatory subunit
MRPVPLPADVQAKGPSVNEVSNKALLPAGLRDVLPPDAAFAAQVVAKLMTCFESHGYEQVDPPLVEFEDSLLSGAGAATASQTFRLMDPVSQHMMGLRTDITVQVARIATTRLTNAPRPLRLCYAGQVLRVKGTQLNPERQFAQAGIELIGSDSAAADAEIVTLAVEALQSAGVSGITADLTMPTLVPALCAAYGFPADVASRLRAALNRKDAAGVAAIAGAAAPQLLGLLRASGPAGPALDALARLELPDAASADRQRLAAGAARIRAAMPGLAVTVDAVEHRGFEYHSGMSFTLFADGTRGEIGRGGRYRAGQNGGEAATGCTIFLDSVLDALPRPEPRPRLFVPAGVANDQAAKLRAEGWITVSGLEEAEPLNEARRLRCTHAYISGKVVALP